MNSATGTKKTVGFGKALVVFICVFVLILCGINVLGTSAHIPLHRHDRRHYRGRFERLYLG